MLQVGKTAPNFELESVMPDGSFKNIRLEDYKGKWVVVFFYPLDFTFVCPTEITGFSKRIGEFRELNAEVIGISVDSVHSHLAWINSSLGKIEYPLASDIGRFTSKDYNVLMEDKGFTLRGTYIVDPDGVLKWLLVNDNNVGRSVDETLRVIRALQTGERCPVDWEAGQATLGK